MQAAKAKRTREHVQSVRRLRDTSRRGGDIGQRANPPNLDSAGQVEINGRRYELVPADEFRRLFDMAELRELVATLEDPNTEWIDWEDAKLRLAGRSIAEVRKARGLTQTQLARKLGVPQSQISRIERNPDRTTVRTLKRIARALRVDVSKLI